jgi:hypothetical protein
MNAPSRSLHTTANLLAFRPEMASPKRPLSDLEKVEAIERAIPAAILAAGRGTLRESAAGHALLNAIYDLVEAQEVYDLALEWGSFAGVVKTEEL